MKILLDTQSWLWMLTAPERFSKKARALVTEPEHELFLSSASAWEIAVKYAIGKLTLPSDPSEFVPNRLAQTGVTALPIKITHALQVALLPSYHGDPFDRLLVAQAQVEDLPILTADPQLEAYNVKVLRAEE